MKLNTFVKGFGVDRRTGKTQREVLQFLLHFARLRGESLPSVMQWELRYLLRELREAESQLQTEPDLYNTALAVYAMGANAIRPRPEVPSD